VVRVFVFLFWYCVFFTVGTLLGFGGGFGAIDTFLEFLLEGFFEKLSTFIGEEGFHEVECLSMSGGIGDQVAFGEQGGELLMEKFVNGGEGAGKFHKIRELFI